MQMEVETAAEVSYVDISRDRAAHKTLWLLTGHIMTG